MLNKICLLVLLQLWLVINPSYAQGIRIVVSPAAKVVGPLITLGELAQISGDDVLWIKSLGQLKLGSAPSLGKSLVFTKELLNMRLAAAGSDFSGILWEIPDSVTVTTSSQSVSGQTLIDKAMATVKEQVGLREGSGDSVIALIGSVQELILPVGKVELTTGMPSGVHYNIPTVVMVTVDIDGQAVTKVPVRFAVKQYGQVVVTAGQLRATETFSTGNLRYERMDIGKMGSGYFTDMKKILGQVSRRSLMPGMVLTDSMVVKPVLVKRGGAVNIIACIGSMEVVTMGQAMQDGIEGQLIRVKNINSTKIISAKVLDEATVQVVTYQSKGNE